MRIILLVLSFICHFCLIGQSLGLYYSATPDFGTHSLKLNSDGSYWFVKGGCLVPYDTQRGDFIIHKQKIIFTSNLEKVKVFVSKSKNKYSVQFLIDNNIDSASYYLTMDGKRYENKIQNNNYRFRTISNDSFSLIYTYIKNDKLDSIRIPLYKGNKYLIMRDKAYQNFTNDYMYLHEPKDSFTLTTSIPYTYHWIFIFKRLNRFKVNLPDYKRLEFQRQKFFTK